VNTAGTLMFPALSAPAILDVVNVEHLNSHGWDRPAHNNGSRHHSMVNALSFNLS
jgi:hypothetical protein